MTQLTDEMKAVFQPIVDDMTEELKSWSQAERNARIGYRNEIQNS